MEESRAWLHTQRVHVVRFKLGFLPGTRLDHLGGQLGRDLLDTRGEIWALAQDIDLLSHLLHQLPLLIFSLQTLLYGLPLVESVEILFDKILDVVNLSLD